MNFLDRTHTYLNSRFEEWNFQIVDIHGKIVQEGILPNHLETVELSSLKAGNYSFVIQHGPVKKAYSIIKQ